MHSFRSPLIHGAGINRVSFLEPHLLQRRNRRLNVSARPCNIVHQAHTPNIHERGKPLNIGQRLRAVVAVNDQQLAGEIIDKIATNGDFWRDIYEPFSRSDISRETVRLVIEKARAKAGKTMPAVARYLKATTDGVEKEDEQRQLFRFKNFLYKTVKI